MLFWSSNCKVFIQQRGGDGYVVLSSDGMHQNCSLKRKSAYYPPRIFSVYSLGAYHFSCLLKKQRRFPIGCPLAPPLIGGFFAVTNSKAVKVSSASSTDSSPAPSHLTLIISLATGQLNPQKIYWAKFVVPDFALGHLRRCPWWNGHVEDAILK